MLRIVPLALIACLALFGAGQLSADVTLTIVHSFDKDDGWQPIGALVDGGDGYLYGTTQYGGIDVTNPAGTVFRITPGGALTTLYSFDFQVTGDEPFAGVLRLGDGTIFGTTRGSGAYDGNVFRLSSTGDYTNVHVFAGTILGPDGGHPEATLVDGGDGNVYGTTSDGGDQNVGTIYQIDGGDYTMVYSFSGAGGPQDGGTPRAALLLGDDGALYGTTTQYGPTQPSLADGTVFRFAGGDVTTLHAFHGSDGSAPNSTLVKGPGGYLYGTTSNGGDHGGGTAFRIREDGSDFASLHSFDFAEGTPLGLVAADDDNLYGTTSGGGAGFGAVYRLRPNGNVETLVSFSFPSAYSPRGPLIQAGNGNFYGTTFSGGEPSMKCGGGCGTVYEIDGDALIHAPEPDAETTRAAAALCLGLVTVWRRRARRDRSVRLTAPGPRTAAKTEA